MKAVIFAGGSGTRLWPVSRKNSPKQVQTFGENQQTLLQMTYGRLRRGWSVDNIFVSTGTSQFPIIKKQLCGLPKSHYILEPMKRDTAAAIGLVTACLHKQNPHEVIFTAWTDQYIKEEREFFRLVKSAERLVQKQPSRTVTVGIRPRYPDTGLGYIKMDKQIGSIGPHEYFSVERFIEKPDLVHATKYVSDWQYLWNPAWFVFRADAMLDKFKRWLPGSYRILMQIHRDLGTKREQTTIRKLFPKLEKISIDYAVMERDRHMLVFPANITWLDIGSWRTVHDMLAADDPSHNIVRGKHVGIDSSGNLIYSYTDRVITTTGLKNMVVIDTKDALLICPKDRSQDVKKIVTELERQKLNQLL